MKYILDTHTLLWVLFEDEKLLYQKGDDYGYNNPFPGSRGS